MNNENIINIASYCEKGILHEKENKNCEDHAYSEYRNKIALAAVSDGAGSYKYSKEGAEITTAAVSEVIFSGFDDLYDLDDNEAAKYILCIVYDKLSAYSCENNIDILELSATLMCMAFHDDGRYMYIHVGDGAIAAMDNYGDMFVLSAYRHTVSANITSFVTETDPEFDFGKGCDDLRACMLMTDGAEHFLVAEEELSPRARILFEISHFISKDALEAEFKALISYLKRKGANDDCSLALICNLKDRWKIIKIMAPNVRNKLLGIPKKIPKSRLNRYSYILRSIVEKGFFSMKDAMTTLNAHSTTRVYKKLSGFIEAGVVSINNNKITF